MSRHPLKIVIAGAGIGGLAAAACLKAAGFEVELYERARELRAVGSALSLMPNALTALERVGVRPDLTRAQAFDSLRFLTRRGRKSGTSTRNGASGMRTIDSDHEQSDTRGTYLPHDAPNDATIMPYVASGGIRYGFRRHSHPQGTTSAARATSPSARRSTSATNWSRRCAPTK
ncbi:hypothetical protein Z046_09330 [Pseudomonas aeruginosa VRFPA09]|nr:hypothetical protein Z046_09330 [Pseudomonas aeruginosa VRFPA09]